MDERLASRFTGLRLLCSKCTCTSYMNLISARNHACSDYTREDRKDHLWESNRAKKKKKKQNGSDMGSINISIKKNLNKQQLSIFFLFFNVETLKENNNYTN